MAVDIVEVKNTVRQYVALKEQMDLMSKRQSDLKAQLIEVVDAYGEVDGKGHIVFEIDDEISGVGKLVKQRKTSKSLDMSVAETLLEDKGLDTCFKTIKVLDEDAIMAAFYKGDLTEDEIDSMFPSKVTYAFLVNK